MQERLDNQTFTEQTVECHYIATRTECSATALQKIKNGNERMNK